MARPSVLRLTGRSGLISAQVFEQAFVAALDRFVDVRTGSLPRFLDETLGPPGCATHGARARAAFRAATTGTAVLSVDHQGLIALPRLARLRNQAGAPVRLLVIAHAPGMYPLDWALLRPLLRSGDRIVAPTESARGIITELCPDLSSFVRVVPHAVTAEISPQMRTPRMLVLGRLVPDKLVHRVIDAHARLLGRGRQLALDLAGPVTTPDGKVPRYVRTLQARVTRLGTGDHVRLLGSVAGSSKSQLLADARLLVNLSVSMEESFGKSTAEALAHGVPVIVTAWDGLAEVAGPGGVAVPVEERMFGMDVDPDAVADAIEQVIEQGLDADTCRQAAGRFHPRVVGRRYRQILEEALDDLASSRPGGDDRPGDGEPAAPPTGLLATAAPLTAYAWTDVYRAVVEESDQLRRARVGVLPAILTEGGHVRTRLVYALRRPLERLFAGMAPGPSTSLPGASPTPLPHAACFLDRIVAAISDPGATLASRVVCLDLLWSEGRREAARRGLELLQADGAVSPGIHYLEIEVLAHDGQVAEALQRCLAPGAAGWWDEHAAHRLGQLARVAVQAGLPEHGLRRLRSWTDRFPDDPDAGEVWLALALCSAAAGLRTEARRCLARARHLLGAEPRVLAAATVLAIEDQGQ